MFERSRYIKVDLVNEKYIQNVHIWIFCICDADRNVLYGLDELQFVHLSNAMYTEHIEHIF